GSPTVPGTFDEHQAGRGGSADPARGLRPPWGWQGRLGGPGLQGPVGSAPAGPVRGWAPVWEPDFRLPVHDPQRGERNQKRRDRDNEDDQQAEPGTRSHTLTPTQIPRKLDSL